MVPVGMLSISLGGSTADADNQVRVRPRNQGTETDRATDPSKLYAK